MSTPTGASVPFQDDLEAEASWLEGQNVRGLGPITGNVHMQKVPKLKVFIFYEQPTQNHIPKAEGKFLTFNQLALHL